MDDNEKTNYIKIEEVCTLLNKELNSDMWTNSKFMKLVKKGLIKFHDLRTPGTKHPRYFFVYDEVKTSIHDLRGDKR